MSSNVCRRGTCTDMRAQPQAGKGKQYERCTAQCTDDPQTQDREDDDQIIVIRSSLSDFVRSIARLQPVLQDASPAGNYNARYSALLIRSKGKPQ